MSGKTKDIVQMRYALVNGELAEPQAGLHGECPFCHEEVLSKCGDIKVHHWAHVNKGMCDPWWENKTEWHRNWQDKFFKQWQEVRIDDKDTADWHVADICTPEHLVVEFQHSALKSEKIIEREQFYRKNASEIIWVVDGTKNISWFKNFLKGFDTQAYRLYGQGSKLVTVENCEKYFPKVWLPHGVIVVLDFKGLGDYNDFVNVREPLYLLMPKILLNKLVFMPIGRDGFVEGVRNGNLLSFITSTEESIKKLEEEIEQDRLRRIRRYHGR